MVTVGKLAESEVPPNISLSSKVQRTNQAWNPFNRYRRIVGIRTVFRVTLL